MVKAIIFDLDNTLIDWKDEYINSLKYVLKDYHLSNDSILKIDDILNNLEKIDEKLNINKVINYINKTLNLKLTSNFLEELIIKQGKCYEDDLVLRETIKYLSSKYDLYVMSNWFTKTQKIRLANLKILEYFKDIKGADQNYYKPDKRAYEFILTKYKPEECLFIGDDLEIDIKPALELGMQVIWKTKENSLEYQTIKEIKELKNIL